MKNGALKYFETSAKIGDGIQQLFEYVALQTMIQDKANKRRSLSGMLRGSVLNLSQRNKTP
jgi:translation initiation factor IF-2